MMGISPLFAGSTEYRVDVDTIEQSTPPGAVGQNQVLIIDNDKFGNQRTLRIGDQGGTVTRPKACTLEDPGPGMDCTGRDLRGAQWDNVDLSGARFDGADLRNASMRGAQLPNATFQDAKLDDADFSGAELINCDFNNARLTGAHLANTQLINTVFMNADLGGADFRGASMINADFMAAQLDDATWVDGQRCAKGSIGKCLR
jgi:uncharacterized protein YjbI with pentapeptide repeats